jgi:hypothetical protein
MAWTLTADDLAGLAVAAFAVPATKVTAPNDAITAQDKTILRIIIRLLRPPGDRRSPDTHGLRPSVISRQQSHPFGGSSILSVECR